jgi:hypothetical protein
VVNQKGKILYERDEQDGNTLCTIINNAKRRLKSTKKYLWRTRQDGTLRAMLTDKYAIVNNEWLLEVWQRLIPGGRLSHWRGDSDTIYGNILIPDSIREEDDSDYGGFLTLFFNLLINIQLLLIGYRAGALRLIFAQAIIMLLEFFIPILPSAVENVVVYAIFTKIKKVLAKKNSSEVDEPDEYVAEPA